MGSLAFGWGYFGQYGSAVITVLLPEPHAIVEVRAEPHTVLVMAEATVVEVPADPDRLTGASA